MLAFFPDILFTVKYVSHSPLSQREKKKPNRIMFFSDTCAYIILYISNILCAYMLQGKFRFALSNFCVRLPGALVLAVCGWQCPFLP